MIEWVKAAYKDKDAQKGAGITPLEYLRTEGVFNLFVCSNGEMVVIFNNQTELLKYVMDNQGSVFMVRFLKEGHKWNKYNIKLEGVTFSLTTLAMASVLVEGTKDEPRKISNQAIGELLMVE